MDIININMEENINARYAQSNLSHLGLLGQFVHNTRLNQNRTQQWVANVAGINRSTLVQLEKGKGATLLTFIQVLRALEQLHMLANFEIKQTLSPLLLAELEHKKKYRASKQKPNSSQKSTW